MKPGLIAGVLAILCVARAAVAEPECPRWTQALKVLNAATIGIKANGLPAVGTHRDDFEQVLADMDKPCPGPAADTVEILCDGVPETLLVTAAAIKQYPGKKVVVVNDPYPTIALLLGSYYVEARRYDDALRVFDRERSIKRSDFGVMRPGLASERAVALGQLHRWGDALAAYDEGLTLASLSGRDKARMHRGRGLALTELGRIDDAEVAYRESLKFEPGNYVALHELEYILKLKLGGAKAPVGAPVQSGQLPETN